MNLFIDICFSGISEQMDGKLNMRVKEALKTEQSTVVSLFRGTAGNHSGLHFQEIHLLENSEDRLGAY